MTLLAWGRDANTGVLGLAHVGVELTDRGAVQRRYRVSRR
jgi:pyruvate/2-oxoglutarate dehydrogenase complex dihydrolipoamide dehydrogenase (E3) component